jgi:hypothetical protein
VFEKECLGLFFAHLMVLGDEEEDTCHMRRRIHVI